MTNMQLAFSELIENVRHHKADESNTAKDIAEKIKHNRETEALTAAQNNLNKYLGELNAQLKQKEILTNAEINKLRIATDKAIADAKQNLSEREYETAKAKAAAEIKKLEANTQESITNAANTRNLEDAQRQKLLAEANYRNAKSLGSLQGIAGALIGKVKSIEESPAGQALNKVKTKAAVAGLTKAYEVKEKVKSAFKDKAKDEVKKKIETVTGKKSK